jgi:hypothetical protein
VPFAVKPHILMLPVAVAHALGLTLTLAVFVIVGQIVQLGSWAALF